ncbi:MAG: GSCFA domain-containing protein [Bacteroidetes bacterium]|nr:GSCFA domain-containing protein [Bacteroidota bacterium]MBV6460273.1 hypothetical protein [Flavobacteriales bacterium]WKZ74641.1 MAG: GSCFA domain-containing protein [Vicingaceae bacterium]MCL4815861.1 GSCFA domain-containing protein [Flavobacteriales bacterium]NOG94948.1 GSCFA domain-containing protein [Bacteroidota bacterium]
MEFRTQILPKELKHKINYQKPCVSIGSCFATNMGEKLLASKFNILINPFGIIYNPVSIANTIIRSTQCQYYNEQELIYFNHKFISLDHHGEYSSADKSDCLEKINSAILKTNTALKNASHLFITLGTAWIYKHLQQNKVAANCHKIPQKEFEKTMLSSEEIIGELQKAIYECRKINNSINIVFTLSPVRHLNDGFVENQLSKSILHFAIQQIIREADDCHYFPAYEIMMDDLRDYRFYKEDMLHPNETAIQYIWEKFCQASIEKKSLALLPKIEEIRKALQHLPFSQHSEEYKKFALTSLQKIELVKKDFPEICFERETTFFEEKIKG